MLRFLKFTSIYVVVDYFLATLFCFIIILLSEIIQNENLDIYDIFDSAWRWQLLQIVMRTIFGNTILSWFIVFRKSELSFVRKFIVNIVLVIVLWLIISAITSPSLNQFFTGLILLEWEGGLGMMLGVITSSYVLSKIYTANHWVRTLDR